MPVTDFLQMQRAEAVAEDLNRPRRILRLEMGAGMSCSYTATTNTITATLQATDGGGGAQTVSQVPILAATARVERREGVVVGAATVYAAGDYTGTTTLQTVLASPSGDTVRARLWSVGDNSYVSGAALTTDATTPTLRTSGGLTLTSTASVYELHLDMAGAGEDSDDGLCSFAALRTG